MRSTIIMVLILVLVSLCSCAKEYPGPDKQFAGSFEGAATGAGSGAITGFQLGSGAGPGALVGAGLGAVAGGIRGAAQDSTEENLIQLKEETEHEKGLAFAHRVLEDQLKRRIELHPTREIYPADLFFVGDEVKLRAGAWPIVSEIARLNKARLSWSRLVVAAYAKASAENSAFAKHLTERRSIELSDCFIRAGIEPRRIETRAVVINEPILIDPYDNPERYNQAIELIPLDR